MILYHAGLSKIEKFDLSRGCHFGGKDSAFEAALRKVPLDSDIPIYMHRVSILDEVLVIYETFDAGSEEKWKDVISFAISQGCNSLKYSNKYEPSSRSSFILLKPLESSIVLESTSRHRSKEIENYLSANF